MKYTAPVVGAVAGGVVGLAQRSDTKSQRWYCAPKQYGTWVGAGVLVAGAGMYFLTDLNPDISYGAMITGATFLGQTTGKYLVRPKNICPGPGCHSTGKSGCYGGGNPWVQGYINPAVPALEAMAQMPYEGNENSTPGVLQAARIAVEGDLNSPAGVLQ